MKKRMAMMVLAGSLTAAAVFSGMALAEETQNDSLLGVLGAIVKEGAKIADGEGDVSDLFSEDGALASLVPEGVDVDSMLQSVENQLNDANSELSQVVDQLKEAIGSEAGSVDLEGLGEVLGTLLMQGDGEITDEEIEDFFTDYTKPVIEEYLLEKNADELEQGDIQLFTQEVKMENEIEEGTFLVLCTYLQTNYAAEDTDLLLAGGARDTMLLTIETAEDGTMSVADAKFVEDGESYAESLEALCEEYGTTSEYYNDLFMFTDYYDVSSLVTCLEEHPEYERIEYMGDLYTYEEIKAIADELLDAEIALLSGEGEAEEDVTEGVSESTADFTAEDVEEVLTEALTE